MSKCSYTELRPR